MAFPARETITVFRKDPMCLPFMVEGADLTGVTCGFAIGLYPDAPTKLVALGMTTTAGDPGVRFIATWTDDDGVKWSQFEIIATKAQISGLPAAVEVGADLLLAFDFQWTLPPDGSGFSSLEETVLYGDIILKGSIND